MAIFNNILAGAAGQTGGAAAGYEIERSLRFDSGSSGYLSKNFSSAGDRKTWTASFWTKRCLSNTTFYQSFLINRDNASYNLRIDPASASTTAFKFYFAFASGVNFTTTQVFRDPSAWMHVVVVYDSRAATTSTDRLKLYINGERVTAFDAINYPTDDQLSEFNNSDTYGIGYFNANTALDGYLADYHFIDGQALAETDFGEVDDNNVWQPIDYTGTYGTNGFHLDFSDNSSVTNGSNTGIGKDVSGNGNYFDSSGISVASGVGNDSLLDSPTNGSQSDTGAGGEVSGNYCTLNPLHHLHAAALANGNLQTTSSEKAFSTFLLKTGKWYVEHKIDSTGYNLCFSQIDHPSGATPSSTDSKSIGWYIPNGYVYWGGTNSSANLGGTTMTGLDSSGYMSNAAVGDIIAAAIDMDNSTIKFYKNGSEVGSIDFSTGTAHRFTEGMYVSQFDGYGYWNFGQRAFAYTAPSGYKALCTANLDDPTIADGSDYFDIATYGGGADSYPISGLAFSPDLVWSKRRDSAGRPALVDTVRGATLQVSTDRIETERTVSDGLEQFNTDGYDVGTDDGEYGWNGGTSSTFVNWIWDAGTTTDTNNTAGSITPTGVRANTSAGFSIVSYTGDGAASATIGHGLNDAPEFIMVKNRDVNDEGRVYHVGTDVTSPQNYFLRLFAGANGYSERSDTGAVWNDTAPTSSVFSVGTEDNVNASTEKYIAYCWTSVEGYSAFGSYKGNGSTTGDGPFVYTGFRPSWLMIKISTGTTSNWVLLDKTRNPYNVVENNLYADTNAAENQFDWVDFLSNGFKIRIDLNQVNGNNYNYIYAAFAEHPFKTARAR